jgi:hypothetical protein
LLLLNLVIDRVSLLITEVETAALIAFSESSSNLLGLVHSLVIPLLGRYQPSLFIRYRGLFLVDYLATGQMLQVLQLLDILEMLETAWHLFVLLSTGEV